MVNISANTSRSPRAYLLDVDGTLLSESGAIPGAAAAIVQLRRRGVPFRILTNITRRSRQRVVDRLLQHGIEVRSHEVFTAVLAGVGWLERRGIRRVAPFVAVDALEDLQPFELVGGTSGATTSEERPEAILIGDLGERWSHSLLNEAFRYVMDGAHFLALQRGRYWQGPTGLEVDAGAYVAALEYATGREAVVCGKPNPEFFQGAVADLEGEPAGQGGVREDIATVRPSDRQTARPPIVMVGDDLWSDIQGAQRAGLEAWLVRTGKFRQEELRSGSVTPDRVIDSVAVVGQ